MKSRISALKREMDYWTLFREGLSMGKVRAGPVFSMLHTPFAPRFAVAQFGLKAVT